MADHLYIRRYDREFERKKNGRPRGPAPKEGRSDFVEVQRRNINEMLSKHAQNKLIFSPYFDPNLIFRIKVIGNPDENSFAKFLRACGLRYISPSPGSAAFTGKSIFRVSHAEDDNLDEINRRLEQYAENNEYRTLFNLIDSIEKIPGEDKTGYGLIKRPLSSDATEYVDIEIWRMEPDRLNKALEGLIRYITEHGGKVTDKITKRSFCLIRAKIDKTIFDEILPLNEISLIDRPPRVSFFPPHEFEVPLDEYDSGTSPSADAPSIIVLDSGVLSGHPFLENCIGDEIEAAYLLDPQSFPNNYVDDVGHGTEVAGVALYGDLKECNDNRRFCPDFFILSGKVLYKKTSESDGSISADLDDRITIESLIDVIINFFCDTYPNAKVVNISFQTEKETFNLRQQHRLSALIDEIAKERELIFVVSAGNTQPIPYIYPHYLLENTPEVKIVEPASSAYALTVGSITQQYQPANLQSYLIPQPGYPSSFTSVGPGLNGMVKPEFVEDGGNLCDTTEANDPCTGVFVLNPQWRDEGKFLTTAYGTSFSAPKISYYIARLFKKYPNYHPNTIKALLLSSATYPRDRPEPLNCEFETANELQRTNLLNVYGYGKPNIDRAEESVNNHLCIISQDEIAIDGVHFYEIYLPEEYVTRTGRREISVTLVYDPPTTGTRIDYFGVKLSFTLFKNTSGEELERFSPHLVHGEGQTENRLSPFPSIELQPSKEIRSKGIHQKGSICFKSNPRSIDTSKPLVLSVICKGNWMKKEDFPEYKQNYSVIITLKHQAPINLYNQLASLLKTRIKI